MNMRRCLAVVGAILALACAKELPTVEPGVGALPTVEQFRAAHPGTTFQAAPQRRATILAGVNTVTNGMSRHRVAALLGRPDWSRALVPKEHARPLGSEWTYLLASDNLDLVNERTDQRLHVYFSPAGVVTHVAAINVAVSPPTGRPAGT